MTAVSLLDALQSQSRQPEGSRDDAGWLIERMIDGLLSEWDRLLEYEKRIGWLPVPTANKQGERRDPLYDLFRQWADDAHEVLSRARNLVKEGPELEAISKLYDAHGSARARLALTPEMISRALDQVAEGKTIPAEELRDELQVRVRARC